MIKEFIMEYSLEKVMNTKTKEYLNEVISCYNNHNYRATITVLYTVVIFDILHKVEELSELYNNKVAKDIINKIDKIRENNPYSSKWEDYLIYRVTLRYEKKDTEFNLKKVFEQLDENAKEVNCLELFDNFGLVRIMNLKKDRNLCAHPTNDRNRDLRNFNQEDARLHIRNMFELVFLKDSFYIADFIKTLDDDILKYSDKYSLNFKDSIINKNIEKYFIHSYLKNSTEEQKKFCIQHLLEKIISNDELKKQNLIFNILDIFIEKNIELSQKIFEDRYFIEKTFKKLVYKVEKSDTPISLDNAFSRVVMLFFRYPQLFYKLDFKLKEQIEIECTSNYNYYIFAYFLEDDFSNHLKKSASVYESIRNKSNIDDCYDIKVISKLYDRFKDNIEFINFLFEKILDSGSYNQSTKILENIFPKMIRDFSKNNLIKLLKMFNSNRQYYGLGSANQYDIYHPKLSKYVNEHIKLISEKLGKDFDYSVLENIHIRANV